MTVPRAASGMGLDDLPLGRAVGRSWVLLFGVIPFDYDDLTLVERGPGLRFLERSPMGSMRLWQHERLVGDIRPPPPPACGMVQQVVSAPMGLADTFQEIVDSLPDDWTDLELDLRITDETRYVDAAVYLVTCNAQPYSKHDWHWRLLVAHRFGHAAAAPTVHGTLKLLDDARIEGELAVREVRSGRVEVQPMWGRPESIREQYRRVNAQ